jgi:AAA ATPase domain
MKHAGVRTVRASGSRPFVGRVRERALLRHLLREAGAGRPAVVIVTGVPGAGKTALLHWMGDEAAAAGAFVLRALGSEGTLPFDALRRLVAPEKGPVLTLIETYISKPQPGKRQVLSTLRQAESSAPASPKWVLDALPDLWSDPAFVKVPGITDHIIEHWFGLEKQGTQWGRPLAVEADDGRVARLQG